MDSKQTNLWTNDYYKMMTGRPRYFRNMTLFYHFQELLVWSSSTLPDAWQRARPLGYWKRGVDYIHPPFCSDIQFLVQQTFYIVVF